MNVDVDIKVGNSLIKLTEDKKKVNEVIAYVLILL